MIDNKTHNFNYLNLHSLIGDPLHIDEHAPRLEIIELTDPQAISEQYSLICQKHKMDNKWIFLINPTHNSINTLTTIDKIDPTKILRINTRKNKININNIEMALMKGNCSAVILCNVHFDEQELLQLSSSAKKGNTTCIVLNNSPTLH